MERAFLPAVPNESETVSIRGSSGSRQWHCLAWGLILLSSVASCGSKKTRVEAVEPTFGNVAGDNDAVVMGSGFKPGLSVRFGRRPASKIVIESDSKIRVKTPAGPEGRVDVVVTDETGSTYVLKKAFTYRRESP